MLRRSTRGLRDSAKGQSLVLFTLALVALLAMTSLVIDAGNAFAQQRITQNGADAAADAGAVVLAQNLIAVGNGATTPPKTDQMVLSAVNSAAANNGISPAPTAYYTDIHGDRLAGPVLVGSLPPGAVPPSAAYGVEVNGSRTSPTYFGGVFAMLPGGDPIYNIVAGARATAIAGQVNGICPADAPCGFLPVTFPTTLTLCDGSNNQVIPGEGAYKLGTPGDPNSESIIPLCKTGDGSVGWLDFTPHNPLCKGNGDAYLACEIIHPGNTGLPIPIWVHTVTGNTNSTLVQDAMNTYIGQTIEIPFYECTSDNVGQVGPAPYCNSSEGSPVATPGSHGNNTYYRIVAVANFVLDRAYIQSNNPECNESPGGPPVGGNGATGCLKGWFVEALNYGGPIGLPSGNYPWSAYGTQLIR